MAKTQRHRHRNRKNKRGGLFGWGESNNNNTGYNNTASSSNGSSWLGNLWTNSVNSVNSAKNNLFRKNTQPQPQQYQGMPQEQGYFGGRYKNKRTKRTKRTKRGGRRTRRHR